MTPRVLLDRRRPLLGMVHLLPSPGSPGFRGVAEACSAAVDDANALIDNGFDGLILENFHDFPPLPESEMGPEVAAYFTAVAVAVRDRVGGQTPIGVQVLFAAHRVAMAVALAAELDFIRAEAWTYAHVADKGIAVASAGSTVRYAAGIGAENVQVFADVKKKHASHALTQDLSLPEVAAGLADHAADAVVVTGTTTGSHPLADDLNSVRRATTLPILIGSGLDVTNAPELVPLADGAIVGSSIKVDGNWRNPVDPDRTRELARCVEAIR